MSVCLSACISQKTYVQTSQKFLYRYMLSLYVVRSCSDNNTLHMSSFVDDSMFAHNRPCKGDASRVCAHWLTRCKVWCLRLPCFCSFVVQLMVKALPFDGLADDVRRHIMELTVTAQLLLNYCRQQEVNQRGTMLNSCGCRLRRCQSRMHH